MQFYQFEDKRGQEGYVEKCKNASLYYTEVTLVQHVNSVYPKSCLHNLITINTSAINDYFRCSLICRFIFFNQSTHRFAYKMSLKNVCNFPLPTVMYSNVLFIQQSNPQAYPVFYDRSLNPHTQAVLTKTQRYNLDEWRIHRWAL